MQPFPKQVYKWYTSASLHTGKKRIPVKLWVFLACLLAIPLLIWLASSKLMAKTQEKPPAKASTQAERMALAPAPPAMSSKLTADQYIDERTARLKDFPHTAPAYDEVTRPIVAPYPAACLTMGKTCKCYSQQATLLHVSGPVCLQIVAQGFFVDWQQAQQQPMPQQLQQPQQVPTQPPPPKVVTRPMPDFPKPQEGLISQSDITTALGLKNPQHSGLPRMGNF